MKIFNNKKLLMVGLFIVIILLILMYYCNCANVDILENNVDILKNNGNSIVISNNKDILLGDKIVVNSNTNCKWLDLFTNKSSHDFKSYFVKNDYIKYSQEFKNYDEESLEYINKMVRNYKIPYYCLCYGHSLLSADILEILKGCIGK
uniref:Uncharacterized protein n=1 Tax=Chrysoporthe austroafricana TaxID=354353 RepID=A0A191MWU4_9PEZI|nr:hypothetical protein [Chrysoporthe austroafricana]AMX22127.1 hypothetical protein [Chrysoporthe austroafricana]